MNKLFPIFSYNNSYGIRYDDDGHDDYDDTNR